MLRLAVLEKSRLDIFNCTEVVLQYCIQHAACRASSTRARRAPSAERMVSVALANGHDIKGVRGAGRLV